MFRRKHKKKPIAFSVPIKKELDNGKTITYKIKFIDSFRFMSSSISTLVDNLYEGFIIISVQIVSFALIIYQLKIIN